MQCWLAALLFLKKGIVNKLYIAQDLWKSRKSENPFLGERGKGGAGAERTGKSQVRTCKEARGEVALSLGVCAW